MGFKQTSKHRFGNGSYHQVGLVRGQFGNVPMPEWLDWLKSAGFDGYEAASWELGSKCRAGHEIEALAAGLVEDAKIRNLEIFSVATHLQGQALGDEPSAKTLQFVGSSAVAAYQEWRSAGNTPPRENPYYVPPEVGALIQREALDGLIAAVRLAARLGEMQERVVPISSFVGSPAHSWADFFEFPPRPEKIGNYDLADSRKVSLELMVERFAPVWDLCKKLGVPFGLECHPSERAMGDLQSADDYLGALIDAGYYEDIFGFNFDASHMLWQGVDPIAFIREFGDYIFSVHLKGVWVSKYPTRHGLLGGHQPMGSAGNGWNFVTAGSPRDCIPEQEVIVELNRVGFDGALSIEWEDSDQDQNEGARLALRRIRDIDLPPSGMRHDEALKA